MLTYKTPQRYDFFHENGFSPVFECKEGDFVNYSDYSELESKVARLEWENQKLKELTCKNK